MTLNDNTEIVHSEMKEDGTVDVVIETPDERYGFKHAKCTLPGYEWKDVYKYSDKEIAFFEDIISRAAHLIIKFSQEGGLLHATTV